MTILSMNFKINLEYVFRTPFSKDYRYTTFYCHKQYWHISDSRRVRLKMI